MLKVPNIHKGSTQMDTSSLEMGAIRNLSPSRSSFSKYVRAPREDVYHFEEIAFCCLPRESRPRIWFIKLMCWPWFERLSILVILLNCVTLGMYDPFDEHCVAHRCKVLETVENCIYAFFLAEMLVKWVAMGLFGKQGYFADSWNKLDCFIVAAGTFELAYGEGEYLSAVRSIRVLRPLRAINRVPNIRILVMLLLDTLPMLGNVLAICFFIFAIFGIIGVQLWQGLLRSRCFPDELNQTVINKYNLSEFYRPSFDKPDYVCSLPGNSGSSKCDKQHFNQVHSNGVQCNGSYPLPVNISYNILHNISSPYCVDWNQYYTTCRDSSENIYYGSISFDNIGIATVAIFQIITLEGWTDIMYKIQDAHSLWNWVYFVVLILLGSYFMTNLCLVVITSQFQETKQRETELLKLSRLRSRASVSTMSSSFMQHGCYTQILHYLEHLGRRSKRWLRRSLKLDNPPKRRRVNPCVQLKGRRDNVKSVHHHHHHYHYYHHFVHHPPCKCSAFEPSDSPPTSTEPFEQTCGIGQDSEDQKGPKESKRILVVPQIKVFAQAATALYKDTSTDASGEMVSTATANVNVPGHESSASVFTYSKTADAVSVAAQATTQTIETACSCASQQQDNERLHVVRRDYDSTDSSTEEGENSEDNRGTGCCDKKREFLKTFVESSRFNRVIMVSIFLNTVCMAVEHHGQPTRMAEILEILNIIFTSIFALEMLVKITAFGPYGYIKDPYNLFDGVIVIVSLMDIFTGNDDSGVSVLRSFRLLRIFKLVRFMPALQRQLCVMVKTLDNVMTFLALLSLFIFTASILGMHLFGAKYSFENEDGQLVVARANFDSLFWALVTVFQVLTQEDWNVVLYDGMRATSAWAALYFIFLMIIGNYILFNLLVAILVEGFADQTENERFSLKFDKEQANSLVLAKRNNAASDIEAKDPYDRDIALSWPNINAKCRAETAVHKPITRCNSAPGRRGVNSRKPERSSSYLHVLTIDALEAENKESGEETGSRYDKNICSSSVDEDTSLVPINYVVPDDDRSAAVLRRPSWFQRKISWSLYIFSPENRFRKCMMKIHSNVWFDRIVLFFILFNCVVMVLEEPGLDSNSKTAKFITIMQYIFTAIFTIEMSIKVISLGLIIGPNAYLRSGWNVIDGILVLLSLVDLIVSLATHTNSGILGVLRVFRAFRTLRPLRVINRAPELKLVVETLLSSLKPIGNVVLIAATFFIIFGILGVQLFKGKFYSCHDVARTVDVHNKTQCLGNGGKWTNNEYNFDHLARALLTLFVFATRDGWVSIMYSGVDAVGVDQQPQRDHSKWNVLYFVAFLLLAGFVVLNMLVGVVVENFHKCRDQLLKEQNSQIVEKNKLQNRDSNDSFDDLDYESFSPLRQRIFFLVTHDYFDLAIAVVIGINVLFMAMEHYNQPQNLTLVLKYANYVFTFMFIVEAALKIAALGIKTYFKNRWNCLDMLIVILSIGGIVLDELATSNFPMNPTIIRVMRVLRITRVLKLLKTADGIRSLLDTVGKALPQVANLGLLFLLLFFIFGALGMELFGDISCDKLECEGLDTHAHFRNFGYSVLTLFRVSTGDNWNGILKDTIDPQRCESGSTDGCKIIQNIAPIYFAAFVLITQFVLLNVVVAVMMKHLEEAKLYENQGEFISNRESSPKASRMLKVCQEKRSPETPRRSKDTLETEFPETFSHGATASFPRNESENSEETRDETSEDCDKITGMLAVDNEKGRENEFEMVEMQKTIKETDMVPGSDTDSCSSSQILQGSIAERQSKELADTPKNNDNVEDFNVDGIRENMKENPVEITGGLDVGKGMNTGVEEIDTGECGRKTDGFHTESVRHGPVRDGGSGIKHVNNNNNNIMYVRPVTDDKESCEAFDKHTQHDDDDALGTTRVMKDIEGSVTSEEMGKRGIDHDKEKQKKVNQMTERQCGDAEKRKDGKEDDRSGFEEQRQGQTRVTEHRIGQRLEETGLAQVCKETCDQAREEGRGKVREEIGKDREIKDQKEKRGHKQMQGEQGKQDCLGEIGKRPDNEGLEVKKGQGLQKQLGQEEKKSKDVGGLEDLQGKNEEIPKELNGQKWEQEKSVEQKNGERERNLNQEEKSVSLLDENVQVRPDKNHGDCQKREMLKDGKERQYLENSTNSAEKQAAGYHLEGPGLKNNDSQSLREDTVSKNTRQIQSLDGVTDTKDDAGRKPSENTTAKENYDKCSSDSNSRNVRHGQSLEGTMLEKDDQFSEVMAMNDNDDGADFKSRTRLHGVRLEPLPDNVTKLPPSGSEV